MNNKQSELQKLLNQAIILKMKIIAMATMLLLGIIIMMALIIIRGCS